MPTRIVRLRTIRTWMVELIFMLALLYRMVTTMILIDTLLIVAAWVMVMRATVPHMLI